jgi:hypothetical protein
MSIQHIRDKRLNELLLRNNKKRILNNAIVGGLLTSHQRDGYMTNIIIQQRKVAEYDNKIDEMVKENNEAGNEANIGYNNLEIERLERKMEEAQQLIDHLKYLLDRDDRERRENLPEELRHGGALTGGLLTDDIVAEIIGGKKISTPEEIDRKLQEALQDVIGENPEGADPINIEQVFNDTLENANFNSMTRNEKLSFLNHYINRISIRLNQAQDEERRSFLEDLYVLFANKFIELGGVKVMFESELKKHNLDKMDDKTKKAFIETKIDKYKELGPNPISLELIKLWKELLPKERVEEEEEEEEEEEDEGYGEDEPIDVDITIEDQFRRELDDARYNDMNIEEKEDFIREKIYFLRDTIHFLSNERQDRNTIIQLNEFLQLYRDLLHIVTGQ